MSDVEENFGHQADFNNTDGSSDDSGSSGNFGSRSATLPTLRELPAGVVVSERYRIDSLIGRGAIGSVYKAEHLLLKRFFALKTLNTISTSSLAFKRFRNEAEAASKLDHPNLVRAIDFGLIDGEQPFFVMDLVSGINLSRHIKKNGKLSLAEAMQIFIPISLAVDYAHEAGVVHRDLKPSNIVMEPTQVGERTLLIPKVIDFGIAKVKDNEGQALTRTGEIFGTPMYMSPEQCVGPSVDKRSDIYSLGCVLYEALTGASPFKGNSALQTMMMHRTEQALSLKDASLGIDFPPELEDVIACMLAKDPAHRYQRCRDVAQDLTAICQKYSVGYDQGNLMPTNGESRCQTILARPIKVPPTANLAAAHPGANLPASPVNGTLIILSVTLAAVACAALAMISSQGRQSIGQRIPLLRTLPIFDKTEHSVPSDSRDATSNAAPETSQAVSKPQSRGNQPANKSAPNQDDGLFTGLENIHDADHQRSYLAAMLHDLNSKKFTAPVNIQLSNSSTDALNERSDLEEVALDGEKQLDDGMIKNLINLQLRSLSIKGTKISDLGLKQLTKIRSLERLDVSNTRITADGLQYLRQFPNLHSIAISGNQANDKGLRCLAAMPKLESIAIRRAFVPAASLQAIYSALPALEELRIEQCESLSGDTIKVICKFKNLFLLSLFQTPLEDSTPLNGITNLKHLSALNLSGVKNLKNETLEYIATCSSLKRLYCADAGVSSAGLKSLSKLKQITYLNLCSNDIDDNGLACLSALPVWHLELDDTSITDAGMKSLAQMPQLKSLSMKGCRQFFGSGLPELKDSHIVALDISGTPVTYDYLMHVAELKNLHSLTIIHCPRLSKAAIDSLQKSCPSLRIIQEGKDED